jgi:hypothetical protein
LPKKNWKTIVEGMKRKALKNGHKKKPVEYKPKPFDNKPSDVDTLNVLLTGGRPTKKLLEDLRKLWAGFPSVYCMIHARLIVLKLLDEIDAVRAETPKPKPKRRRPKYPIVRITP